MKGDDDIFTMKAKPIEALMESISGRPREAGHCVFEDRMPEQLHSMDFRTPLDRKEYSISGLCQTCQDAVFAEDEEDDEESPDLDMGFGPDYNVGE
jgi:hypothetical protein